MFLETDTEFYTGIFADVKTLNNKCQTVASLICVTCLQVVSQELLWQCCCGKIVKSKKNLKVVLIV